ncbi:MAG: addiction module toxin RelE [Candidatus Omnitrophica bacterium CG11_big_fil_rev_8_21_14_0_20_64_10]|nr:MAG: addiction module toxin RelE [Candidatus Omnitrophica bacterium CG11_big_fil_rev_8_21_14_0_20_64_10]
MPRPPRRLFKGAFYHVFNRGVEKRVIFLDAHDHKTFLCLLDETVVAHQLRLFAYCLMPNHFHLFPQTPQGNLDSAMHALQGDYAQYFNRRHKRVGSLFQDRYKNPLVEEETYALALCRYIHHNARKAGCRRDSWEDYPWSSYPSYIGKLPSPKWLERSWLLAQFHPDEETATKLFRQYHQMDPPTAETRTITTMRSLLGKPKLPAPA